MNKWLIIGAGGIGSFLAEEIAVLIIKNQIDLGEHEFTIADNDTVDVTNLDCQNYGDEDLGMAKVFALKKRWRDELKYKAERIVDIKQLKGYNLFVLCVDNDIVRKLVINYCYEHGYEFLDMRSTGRKVFCMPKTTHEENIKFVSDDMNTYSCQEAKDKEVGKIQVGNKIAAMIGTQMILNMTRGYNNRITNVVI